MIRPVAVKAFGGFEPESWALEVRARRPKWTVMAFENLCPTLPDQHVGTAERADIQGLVARIEDENALHAARSVAASSDREHGLPLRVVRIILYAMHSMKNGLDGHLVCRRRAVS